MKEIAAGTRATAHGAEATVAAAVSNAVHHGAKAAGPLHAPHLGTDRWCYAQEQRPPKTQTEGEGP